jgi:sarcosine oxidase
MAQPYDVIVAGLGGMGSAAACELARRGKRILGFERYQPGHDQGASHGETRMIREAYFEGTAYVPLVRRAYELWDRLGRDADADLLTRTGGIFLGSPDGEIFAGSRRTAVDLEVPHEVLDSIEVRRRFPTLRPADGEAALFEPGAGFVRPEAAVLAQLDLASRHGADLRFGEAVESWEASAAGVVVTTATGSWSAGALVLALGAWTPQLLGDLDLPLRVERRVMHWFAPDGPLTDWQPDRHPVWIWDGPDGSSPYGFPFVGDGCKVGVHAGPAVTQTPVEIGDLDRSLHAEEVDAVAKLVRQRLPALAGRHVRSSVCTYTLTPDEHFVIGPHPSHGNVVLAAGFSGHGFKFVPVVGEILADLAVQGATPHRIDTFAPGRAVLSGAQ